MSNLGLFFLLYGLSMIPWFLSFWSKSTDIDYGLMMIDAALTISSFIFLWRDIGWWSLFIAAGSTGIGLVLRGFGIDGYPALKAKADRKKLEKEMAS
jgi:hypothetical protein